MILYVFAFRTCFIQDSWGQAWVRDPPLCGACAVRGRCPCTPVCGPCSAPIPGRVTGGHFGACSVRTCVALRSYMGVSLWCHTHSRADTRHDSAFEKWVYPRTLVQSLSCCIYLLIYICDNNCLYIVFEVNNSIYFFIQHYCASEMLPELYSIYECFLYLGSFNKV